MDSVRRKLQRVTQQRAAEREAGVAKYQDQSKERLRKILMKKIQTTFIGDLARVEEHIGKNLWGHGLPANRCTPEQLMWRERWEAARTEILNNGNNQKRAIEAEIAQYTITWNRYQTAITVKGDVTSEPSIKELEELSNVEDQQEDFYGEHRR